jgi:hypothetical protein
VARQRMQRACHGPGNGHSRSCSTGPRLSTCRFCRMARSG